MKKFIVLLIISISLLITSCGNEKLKGEPTIVKKELSLVPGYCLYTYEGWGRREYFEDDCDKYNVGDVLTNTKTND